MAEDNPNSGEPFRHPIVHHEAGSNEVGFLNDTSHDAEADDEGFDLASIWRIFWARRLWILGSGAVGFAIALIYSLLQTPLYQSTAVLELNPPTVPILSGNQKNNGDLAVPQMDWEFLATQYGLLKSRTLAERVVQDLDLASSTDDGLDDLKPEDRVSAVAGSLASGLAVKPVPDSRLVELTYTSAQPARAAQIVNGFADAFIEDSLNRRYEATGAARKFLKKRLETVRSRVNEAERKLVAYAKQNNIIFTGDAGETGSGAGSLASASLEAINAALAVAQQKRIAAEQRYRQAGSITEVRQSTSALRQERERLKAEYQEKSTILQDDYPDMVRIKSRIEALDNAIGREAANASGSLRAEYQAVLNEENILRGRVRQLSANVLAERERSIQYNILQRELDTDRSLYDALLERYNEVGVASGIGTALAAIVDRGRVPGAPFSPNVPRNIILGLFLGLGLGAAAAFAFELVTDTIRLPEDVREKLHLTLLGVIPNRMGKASLAEQMSDDRSAIVESYNTLVATLQFSTSQGLPSSLLITSTLPAEGKSSSSFVIATIIAKLGKRVLLIDADMRKPSFITQDYDNVGLSMLLVGEGRLDSHLVQTRQSNLWLMPSGPVPPNPAHLLSSARMSTIMSELADQFDILIVDAPPVHGFADAPLLASLCSGVVFVVESGKTRRRSALDAISGLKTANATILGALLSKYKATFGDYEYTYQYYDQYAVGMAGGRPHELSYNLVGDEDNGGSD